MEEEELPAEAHHTLFASGLPLDMQKREASHIFRPFEGYKASPGCQIAHDSAACMGSGWRVYVWLQHRSGVVSPEQGQGKEA